MENNVKVLPNPFEYIKSIQDQWAYKGYCLAWWVRRPTMGSTENHWEYHWLLSTGGLSDHEAIIDEMLKTIFWMACWSVTKRGGHYQFEVVPTQWGFKLVNDYAREKGISRQYIYHNPDKFEWVHVSSKIKFIKPIV